MVIFMTIAGAVLLVGATVAYFVARRMVRRRWHRVRNHVATRGALASLTLFAAWRERMGARSTPDELSRGTAARARRKLWVAIEDAESAVHHADATGAPVAELPAVCRSLRKVGGQLDTLLRLESRLPLGQSRPDAVRVQLAEVVRSAHDVQAAALRASSDANEPQIRALVRDARDEVEIAASALARLRSMSPP
jgi:hypothetical protein